MYALVFPGQGVQRRGMGGDVFDDAKDLTAQADEILGYSVAELCRDDPEGRLAQTRYAQPAIYLVNALLAQRRMAEFPHRYTYFAGHSLGEYNALVAAGLLDLMAGLALVRRRAELMAEIGGGTMAAVSGLPAPLVRVTLAGARLDRVHVANHNSDQQVTVAGDRAQMREAVRLLRGAGASKVAAVPVSGPFHTPLMAPASHSFAADLAAASFGTGPSPVVSSVTGELVGAEEVAELLGRQIAAPVEWVRAVRTLRGLGVAHFDEVNGSTLTALIGKIR